MMNDKKPPANAGSKQGSQWQKGQSGNPAGKAKGTRHKATIAAQALLDGEGEALTRRAIELAKGGDITALRLCLERIIPPRRDAPVVLDLPPIKTLADIVAAHAAVTETVAAGDLTPSQGAAMADILGGMGKAFELHDLDRRISALETQTATKGKQL